MLSVERITRRAANRVLLPMASILSSTMPHMPVGTIEKNERYPWIEEDKLRDPLVLHGKLPARLSLECMRIVDRAQRAASLIGRLTELPDPRQVLSALGAPHSELDELFDDDDSESENGDAANPQAAQQRFRRKDAAPPPWGSRPLGAATHLPRSLLVVHSTRDTMCEPSGAIKFYNDCTEIQDKNLMLLDDMWHYLPVEPGAEQLVARIGQWLSTRSRRHARRTERLARAAATLAVQRADSPLTAEAQRGDATRSGDATHNAAPPKATQSTQPTQPTPTGEAVGAAARPIPVRTPTAGGALASSLERSQSAVSPAGCGVTEAQQQFVPLAGCGLLRSQTLYNAENDRRTDAAAFAAVKAARQSHLSKI
eukprot:Selendium_serpulae@DN6364_c5_g1_i11.p1